MGYSRNWPYSQAEMAELRSNATQLIQEFPPDSLQHYQPLDLAPCSDWADPRAAYFACGSVFKQWVDEVHEIAVTEVYCRGIQQHAAPSPDYLANVQAVSRRQIALAGYRLAD